MTMSGTARSRGQRMARDQRASEPPTGPAGPEREQEMQDAPTQITEDGTGSYTPQGDAHGNPMRDEEVDTSESETLTQRYERLKAELAEKRMRQEVKSMERELVDEMPMTRIGDISVLTSGYKRLISTSTKINESQREFFYRPKSPPIFKGKNLKEVSVFKAR